jgi:hypothetical protein
MKLVRFSILMLIGPGLFTACGGDDKEESKAPKKEGPKKEIVDDGDYDSESYESMLPSPMQVAEILNKSGLKWRDGLANSPANYDKYTTGFQKMLNFGVYSMDLVYAVLNERNTESKDYLKAVRELAIETGLDEIFNSEDLVNRLDANIAVKDSMLPLLIEIHERTDEVLGSMDETAKTTVHFAGAWIEGMYLGAITATDKNNTELGATIVSQMVILGNLIKGLQSYPDQSEDMTGLIKSMQDLHDTYMGLESVKAIPDMDHFDPTLTSAELNILKEKIVSLRQMIVKI